MAVILDTPTQDGSHVRLDDGQGDEAQVRLMVREGPADWRHARLGPEQAAALGAALSSWAQKAGAMVQAGRMADALVNAASRARRAPGRRKAA